MKRFLITMMLLAAVTALAADPQSTENSQSGAPGQNEPAVVRGVPAVDVNKAEIEQYGAETKSIDNGLGNLAPVNPLMPEIVRIQEDAKTRLVDLNSRLANQVSDAQALDLIREIESVKVNAELDIMRLQANAAQARGDQATADSINNAIEEMTTPRPLRPAVERPAPAGAGN